jgi:hypothetical protein
MKVNNAGARTLPKDLPEVTGKNMLFGVIGIEHVVVTVMVGVTG